jgi:hypothetical protein
MNMFDFRLARACGARWECILFCKQALRACLKNKIHSQHSGSTASGMHMPHYNIYPGERLPPDAIIPDYYVGRKGHKAMNQFTFLQLNMEMQSAMGEKNAILLSAFCAGQWPPLHHRRSPAGMRYYAHQPYTAHRPAA